jgi:dipeptidyl aminopeptidase/acylaminoacyl peptidase
LIEDSSSGYGSDRLKSFQQEALNHGVVVDIAIHPDEGHRIMGNEARLERTRNMMHFIFEK